MQVDGAPQQSLGMALLELSLMIAEVSRSGDACAIHDLMNTRAKYALCCELMKDTSSTKLTHIWESVVDEVLQLAGECKRLSAKRECATRWYALSKEGYREIC